jgi:hypothetical protein
VQLNASVKRGIYMKKFLSAFLTTSLVLGLALSPNAIKANAATNDNWNSARYGDTLDFGTRIRAQDKNEEFIAKTDAQIKKLASETNFDEATTNNATATEDPNFTFNGGTKKFLAYDDVNGYYMKVFTLRSLGEKVEVWVANDLSFGKDDPRPAHIVTQEQVDKLKTEFDNNIYQKDTEFFGTPDSHTGENATMGTKNYYTPQDGIERTIMLVDNVKDESYYDSIYPFYIAGFYSSSFERYLDRNVITLDTNKWETRLPSVLSTIAHEFQHLIHSDNDSAEETWINEGMADFAEYLCGYGHAMGHVNYFLDHPENSLVNWDEYYNAETGPETLADYGQAYLLQLYLNDHYGKDFIQSLAKDTDHGIESMNKILKQYNTGIDFNELFRRFSVALSVDSKNPAEGIYNFDSIDLKINYAMAAATSKPGVPAWGADYIKIEDSKDIKSIIFDGINFLKTPWKVVDDPKTSGKVLWGNASDEADNKLIFEADLTGKQNATLNFDNYIDIEEQWDFGIVQVSKDNGKTWASLSNKNTRSDIVGDGHPAIKENLPGFTGKYDNWTKETFDLTPYVGQKILISFRYMTDWGTNLAGWFIKNVEIPEIGLSKAGSNLDEFMSIDEVNKAYVDYSVTFVNEKSTNKGTEPQHYQVKTIDMVNFTEGDSAEIQKFLSSGNNYMVVWYAAPIGVKNVAEYDYELVLKNKYIKAKVNNNNKKH